MAKEMSQQSVWANCVSEARRTKPAETLWNSPQQHGTTYYIQHIMIINRKLMMYWAVSFSSFHSTLFHRLHIFLCSLSSSYTHFFSVSYVFSSSFHLPFAFMCVSWFFFLLVFWFFIWLYSLVWILLPVCCLLINKFANIHTCECKMVTATYSRDWWSFSFIHISYICLSKRKMRSILNTSSF